MTTSCVLLLLLLVQAESGGGGLKEVIDKVGLLLVSTSHLQSAFVQQLTLWK